MSTAVGVGVATDTLIDYLDSLTFADLPPAVVERTKALFLDWVASALAGRDAPPVHILERFAKSMGPSTGNSETLTHRARTSPFFAALVNGAASHVVEQDDLHNESVMHPGTVVFPALLAAAQDEGISGQELLAAACVGYEASTRVGTFLGRSHYRVFHTTGTAGTLGAAAAVAHALSLDKKSFRQALGSAGTQAAGLWEFLRDAADSKQLHTAKAASNGLLAAYIARDGFTGARQILEGPQGMAAGQSQDANPQALTRDLGEKWAVLETSFKYHASCRHTHPAADALQTILDRHHLRADQIVKVRAHVHQAALDVLGPVTDPQTTHQAKFSMGFVLALIAVRGQASVGDFTAASLLDPDLRQFLSRVEMVYDPGVDAAYPRRWIGSVEVWTVDGREFRTQLDSPKGDPENPLTPAELEAKAHRLAAFAGGAERLEMERLIKRIGSLEHETRVGALLSSTEEG